MLGASLTALAAAAVLALVAGPWKIALLTGLALLGLLIGERLLATGRSYWRTTDVAVTLFVPVHLLRDLAWLTAIVVWSSRRLRGHPSRPQESMQRGDDCRRALGRLGTHKLRRLSVSRGARGAPEAR